MNYIEIVSICIVGVISVFYGGYLSVVGINNYSKRIAANGPNWFIILLELLVGVFFLCVMLFLPQIGEMQWVMVYSVWLLCTVLGLSVFYLITNVKVCVLCSGFFLAVHICLAFAAFLNLMGADSDLADSNALNDVSSLLTDSSTWKQRLGQYERYLSIESLPIFLMSIVVVTFVLPLKIITDKFIPNYDPREIESAFDEKYKFLVVLDEDIDERKLIQCMTGIGFKYSPANDFGDSRTCRKHFSYFNGYGFIEASSLVKDTFVGSIEVYFTLKGSRSVAIKALSLLVTISEDLGAKVYDLEVYREKCQRSGSFSGRFLRSPSDEIDTDALCQISLKFDSFEQNPLQISKREKFIQKWNEGGFLSKHP